MKLLFSVVFLALSISPTALAGMPKETFTSTFEKKGPAVLCQSGKGLVLKCYKMTEVTCGEAMKSILGECIKENDAQMPASLSGSDGGKFGGLLGSCALKKYTQSNKSKLLDTPECRAFSEESLKH